MPIRMLSFTLILAVVSACTATPAANLPPPSIEATASAEPSEPVETAPRERPFPRQAAIALGVGAAGALLLYAIISAVGAAAIMSTV